ncbi:MAG: hypothetical protein KAH21_11295, partial [Spirochaetaceae bacterium]|nr:hypothetical protein [Spirochaetaceae bacterium]
VQAALGVTSWDTAAEEKFTDTLMNYLVKDEAPAELRNSLEKVAQYLKNLWETTKRIAGVESMNADIVAAYDSIFAKKAEKQSAAQPTTETLHEKVMVTSQDKKLRREETSLGYGVRSYTGSAEAIKRYRNAQARKGAELTLNGGRVVKENGEQRMIMKKIAASLLDLQDGKISDTEFRGKITADYMKYVAQFERDQHQYSPENRKAVQDTLDVVREELGFVSEDISKLGVRIPQLGFVALAETQDGNYLNFGEKVSGASKKKLSKLRAWMTKNNPLLSIVDTVKIGETFRGATLWKDAFTAIESGTGAQVFDALVYAAGSQKAATQVLMDLGFVGGMQTRGR